MLNIKKFDCGKTILYPYWDQKIRFHSQSIPVAILQLLSLNFTW